MTPSLAVAGVTLGGSADSSYVEVLVDIAGCRQEPCRIEVGAFRSLNEEELREQITGKLREHLARHRTGE